MEHEATKVVSASYTSNEFVHATPAYVNENTLVVAVSMRGTPETIVAAEIAREHGATTIGVYVDESRLTEVCEYKVRYDSLAVGRVEHGPHQLRGGHDARHGACAADGGLRRVRHRDGRLRFGRPHLSEGVRLLSAARCRLGRAKRRQALHQRHGAGAAVRRGVRLFHLQRAGDAADRLLHHQHLRLLPRALRDPGQAHLGCSSSSRWGASAPTTSAAFAS